MIRVVLADDEAMIRAGIKAVLSADPGIEVVAEAADGREAVEQVRAHRPDIALLDVRMPRLDGLSAAAVLRASMPEVGVVMLTTFDEDDYVAGALEAGAGGFLLKAADPRELIFGLRAVAEGGAYMSPRIARKVITRLTGGHLSRTAAARAQVDMLTPRERDVLTLVGRGLANQDIARELFLSEGTVKAHVSAILLRLGLTNRVQAAIIAYEAGLVHPYG
ncbi:DNA-binding response regulator, NarL/FixJ family, contains REC and HTH domains [Sinosporangium album]|uniref:DNA-binding response regulator, NarL/FixJ family, contains REC and HTH domains n=1 Tax=Sinosporangium album TaxID=504805 RepID=A0A1G8GA26_9ACTN|nr:response regulator transcription factor [Sinosporangium album]SDH91252.1 DNA-binding response regulator, NarL/FixJ family, contains REC and HTH domains [Sinosporangium album]